MRWMVAHFVGGIYLAFDRPVAGIATATAPAALATDATTALEAAFRCGLAQMPPPRDFPSALALEPHPAHTGRPGPNPSPFSTEYAPEAFSVLEGRLAAGFARPALTRNSLQPCNATRPPRRYRLTPAERTVCVPESPDRYEE